MKITLTTPAGSSLRPGIIHLLDTRRLAGYTQEFGSIKPANLDHIADSQSPMAVFPNAYV